MKNRKGFTIVELVIVIAVIAILAAVLIPTFSGVVQKANESGALQEATSTMKSTLAMSDYGTIADNTQFIIVSGNKVTYKFSYEQNSIKAIEKDQALQTGWNTIIVHKDYINTTTLGFTAAGATLVNAAVGADTLTGAAWTTDGTGYKLTITAGDTTTTYYVLVNTDYAKDIVTITTQTK